MAFSAVVIGKAWREAKGCCERCGKRLDWDNRGRDGPDCWEAHHKTANEEDILSNCEILCFDCHRRTRSFGVKK